MGSVKQYWMEQQELEPMYDWIADNYGQLEDDSEEWEEAVEAYNQYAERIQLHEDMAHAADEYDYYIHFVLEEADEKYRNNLAKLQEFVNQATLEYSDIFYKMVFSHAVTIFEVYMEDITKSLLITDDRFLHSFLQNGRKVLSERKYSVKDFLYQQESIQKECDIRVVRENVLVHLSKTLFHDITKVINNFEAILGRGLSIDQDGIRKVVAIRHDIVHRNGINKNGAVLDIDKNMVLSCIEIIQAFATNIRGEISKLGFND